VAGDLAGGEPGGGGEPNVGRGDIHRRLRSLRAEAARRAEAGQGAEAPGSPKPFGSPEPPGGRQAAGQDRFAGQGGWEQLEPFVYRRCERRGVAVDPAAARPMLSELSQAAGRRLELGDLVFYDTETTGLSSGAGSVVFLIGVGRLEGRSLLLEQLFLSDFPGEPSYLRRVESLLPDQAVCVSFNGKSFDSHILRARFLMNGMHLEIPYQLDLLHPARRLWRRTIGSCSLACLEREVLGIHREGDIPGEEVPELYFRFLRTGRPDLLPPVFRHNLQDTETLFWLYDLMEGTVAGGAAPERVDLFGLGRLLLARGNSAGMRHLEAAFADGDPSAGRLLALTYRRQGSWAEAVSVWKVMAGRRSVHAMVELAKYYEHREKNVQAALAWTRKAAAEVPFPDPTLRHRRERLERKASR